MTTLSKKVDKFMDENITEIFKRLETVQSVTCAVDLYKTQVVVTLTPVKKYNGAIMDTLIETEYSIRKMYPGILFQFYYIGSEESIINEKEN